MILYQSMVPFKLLAILYSRLNYQLVCQLMKIMRFEELFLQYFKISLQLSWFHPHSIQYLEIANFNLLISILNFHSLIELNWIQNPIQWNLVFPITHQYFQVSLNLKMKNFLFKFKMLLVYSHHYFTFQIKENILLNSRFQNVKVYFIRYSIWELWYSFQIAFQVWHEEFHWSTLIDSDLFNLKTLFKIHSNPRFWWQMIDFKNLFW